MYQGWSSPFATLVSLAILGEYSHKHPCLLSSLSGSIVLAACACSFWSEFRARRLRRRPLALPTVPLRQQTEIRTQTYPSQTYTQNYTPYGFAPPTPSAPPQTYAPPPPPPRPPPPTTGVRPWSAQQSQQAPGPGYAAHPLGGGFVMPSHPQPDLPARTPSPISSHAPQGGAGSTTAFIDPEEEEGRMVRFRFSTPPPPADKNRTGSASSIVHRRGKLMTSA